MFDWVLFLLLLPLPSLLFFFFFLLLLLLLLLLHRYEMMRDDALADDDENDGATVTIGSPDYPAPRSQASHRVANAVVHVDPLGSSG